MMNKNGGMLVIATTVVCLVGNIVSMLTIVWLSSRSGYVGNGIALGLLVYVATISVLSAFGLAYGDSLLKYFKKGLA
jgi:hypothetical protein